MIELSKIGEDLFNKIRGRFPNVTIGDETGTVTNEPKKARFFDFDYKSGETVLGKVSVSIDEENGLTVIYSKDFIQNEDELTQKQWYEFLRELRQFSKKRLLNFDVRDINKSNLNKRDYKFLATNRSGDETMKESKLYGTSRISYQKVGEARLVIKHSEHINTESTTGRTQKIGKIYIESPEGERFKYPYKHLSGARAMARHVAEGGNAYDDFGKHIVGLSEEMAKLRKFKTYMGRSAVMAESLAGYMDIVKERITTVKKTIESLQKPAYYKEAFETFNPPVLEDVPSDVAENWIDELTIKQFNEELADVFPYIYNLVKEGTKAKALGPEDLEEKIKGKDGKECWDGYRYAGTEDGKDVCVPTGKGKTKEEIALEQGFEAMMGQFGELAPGISFKTDKPGIYKGTKTTSGVVGGKSGEAMYMANRVLDAIEEQDPSTSEEAFALARKFCKKMGCSDDAKKRVYKQLVKMGWTESVDEADLDEAYIKTSKDAIDTLGALRKIGKKIETGQDTYDGNLAGMYVNDVYDVISWVENNLDTNDPNYKKVLGPVIELRKKAKGMERELGSGKNARFGNEIVNTLYPLMQWIEMKAMDAKEGNAYVKAVRDAKRDGKKKGDKIQGPDGDEITLEKQKTPLGEFILSYYDRETGQFPKGETAVLTMVEKDYGEQFIEPAKAFIEQVNALYDDFQMHNQPQQMEADPEFSRMKELAGLR